MALTKVTFTLSDKALARLKQDSEQLGKSKSQIVREAIFEYHRSRRETVEEFLARLDFEARPAEADLKTPVRTPRSRGVQPRRSSAG